MDQLNIIAVIAAALSSFALGGFWYSPILFGKQWMKEVNFDQKNAGHPAKVFGLSFVFSLVSAGCFGLLLQGSSTLIEAIHLALVVGIGFVVMSFGINYQFANNTMKLLLIDGGYHCCQFLSYALVFSLWF